MVVSAVVIACSFTLAAAPVLAGVRAGAGTVVSRLVAALPAQEPRPAWSEVAALAGGPGISPAAAFTVTGEVVRIRYRLDGPGFIYLLPAGAASVPEGTDPIVSTLEAGPGERILRSAPGEWTLVVRPPATAWSATVEQFTGGSGG
jgi:hypothetical protein